jgi:HPr kinase/phosphorylase
MGERSFDDEVVVSVVSIREVVREFSLLYPTRVVSGLAGLKNVVESPVPHFVGLALADAMDGMRPERIQLLGSDEIGFLRGRSEDAAAGSLKKVCKKVKTGFWISSSLGSVPGLSRLAVEHSLPVVESDIASQELPGELGRLLETLLAPKATMHGTLVEVYGIGVLLMGKSGIGKSECAIDLISRGHRLVADDVVEIRRQGTELIGKGSPLIRHHMEIRGLGIINVRDLFGLVAVCDSHRVDLMIELRDWKPSVPYDRLGLEEVTSRLMERDIPRILVPVRPGRNLSIIVEAAVRNHLLKQSGTFTAQELNRKLTELLSTQTGDGLT